MNQGLVAPSWQQWLQIQVRFAFEVAGHQFLENGFGHEPQVVAETKHSSDKHVVPAGAQTAPELEVAFDALSVIGNPDNSVECLSFDPGRGVGEARRNEPIFLGPDANVPSTVELERREHARALDHRLALVVVAGSEPVVGVEGDAKDRARVRRR